MNDFRHRPADGVDPADEVATLRGHEASIFDLCFAVPRRKRWGQPWFGEWVMDSLAVCDVDPDPTASC